MTRSHARRRPLVPLLALLGLVALGGASAGAVAAADPAAPPGLVGPVPILTGAGATAGSPGTVTVTGEGFTVGGAVYVALYDRWGATLHEHRSTTADRAVYGPNGSQDPAVGFRRGGTLSEAFGGLCGATPMAWAHDRGTARWSNWLDVDPAGLAHHGPNGSQDPALGFSPGCKPVG